MKFQNESLQRAYDDLLKAHNEYKRDMGSCVELLSRLSDNAEAAYSENIPGKDKLAKLKSIQAQMGKVNISADAVQARYDAARARYNGAIDKVHEDCVNEFAGLCSYAESVGKGSAA